METQQTTACPILWLQTPILPQFWVVPSMQRAWTHQSPWRGSPLGLSFLFCEVEIMSPAGGNAHKWPKQGAAHGGCFLFPDCFLRSLSNMCVDIASFSNYWKRAGEEGAVEVGEGESLQRGSSMAGNCSRGRVVTEGVGVADIPRRIKHWPRAGISSQPLVTWSTPICQIPEPPA